MHKKCACAYMVYRNFGQAWVCVVYISVADIVTVKGYPGAQVNFCPCQHNNYIP